MLFDAANRAIVIAVLALGLSLPALAQQDSMPTPPPPGQSPQPITVAASETSVINDLRPSSVVPSTANLTIEQLYTLINERDRQYQQRFDAQEKAVTAALIAAKEAVNAALAAAKEAVVTANSANEKRLDSVNEFRGQQKDLIGLIQATVMPRAEADIRFKTLEVSQTVLSEAIIKMNARLEVIGWLWAALGAIGGGLIALGTLFINARNSFRTPLK